MGQSLPAPSFASLQLVKAFAHPLRIQAMAIFTERGIASPKEVATATGEPLNLVAYHIDALEKLGCIELIDVKPAANGRVVEHFYKASRRPLLNQGEWEAMDDSQKYGVVVTIMRLISEDIGLAMRLGTFLDPDDNHVSRTPMTVDQQGWEEQNEILDDTVRRLIVAQEASDKRIKDSDGPTMDTKVAIIHFRSPHEK